MKAANQESKRGFFEQMDIEIRAVLKKKEG